MIYILQINKYALQGRRKTNHWEELPPECYELPMLTRWWNPSFYYCHCVQGTARKYSSWFYIIKSIWYVCWLNNCVMEPLLSYFSASFRSTNNLSLKVKTYIIYFRLHHCIILKDISTSAILRPDLVLKWQIRNKEEQNITATTYHQNGAIVCSVLLSCTAYMYVSNPYL